MSLMASLLCIAIFFAMGLPPKVPLWIRALPILVVASSALFTIRGYRITSDAIEVQRLGWTTRLPRAGLVSVRYEENIMRRSIRLLGNGGLFAVSGWFRNSALGRYRAFVTDARRTVVLRYADQTVVLSPSPPQLFVDTLATELSSHA
jgi:hypothetical protein